MPSYISGSSTGAHVPEYRKAIPTTCQHGMTACRSLSSVDLEDAAPVCFKFHVVEPCLAVPDLCDCVSSTRKNRVGRHVAAPHLAPAMQKHTLALHWSVNVRFFMFPTLPHLDSPVAGRCYCSLTLEFKAPHWSLRKQAIQIRRSSFTFLPAILIIRAQR